MTVLARVLAVVIVLGVAAVPLPAGYRGPRVACDDAAAGTIAGRAATPYGG